MPKPKVTIHPDLARFVERLKKAKELLDLAEGVFCEAEDELVLQTARHLGMPEENLSLGSWVCEKSPIGRCLYDNSSDARHDTCLCCEEPQERK